MAQEQPGSALRPWHTVIFMVALIAAVTARLILVEGHVENSHVPAAAASAPP